MARFETPIDDPQAAAALRGLDLQSVVIAKSFERSSRLHAFYDQYVEPDTLELNPGDDGMGRYDHQRISAIGDDGSLLHIRLHRQVVGRRVDPSISHLAVIGHIDDPHPARLLTATSEDFVRYDATRQTVFTIGQPDEEQGLQVVDEPMNQLQWNIEKALNRERALRALPLVALTGNGWEYRRSDSHWEKLHDLHRVRERVSQALSRGLGYVALPEVRPQAQEEAGARQFDQKVVV